MKCLKLINNFLYVYPLQIIGLARTLSITGTMTVTHKMDSTTAKIMETTPPKKRRLPQAWQVNIIFHLSNEKTRRIGCVVSVLALPSVGSRFEPQSCQLLKAIGGINGPFKIVYDLSLIHI